MAVNLDGVTIGTISGGIVNFGGAVYISPISITKTTTGAGAGNQGESTTTALEPDSSEMDNMLG